jgi:hypothetical protein
MPGVNNRGMADGQYWPAARGNTWRDAQTQNDGMRANVVIDDGQWQMGWSMNDAATSELTYQTGGGTAEVQTGGVVQNAIPKEGGNTFAGTFFGYLGHERLGGSNADDELRAILGNVNGPTTITTSTLGLEGRSRRTGCGSSSRLDVLTPRPGRPPSISPEKARRRIGRSTGSPTPTTPFATSTSHSPFGRQTARSRSLEGGTTTAWPA